MMIIRSIARKIAVIGSEYVLLIFFAPLLLVGFGGCSNAHNHKTLAFFFDGVPSGEQPVPINLDSIRKADSAYRKKNLAKADKPTIYYHKPFKEKKCGNCHDQGVMGKFLKPQPSLCYQCHDDFGRRYKALHGPVGGGYCTACHDPHTAHTAKLLKRPGQQLCIHCHNSALVLKNEAHQAIADTSCTDCHNPHGGNDRTFMK